MTTKLSASKLTAVALETLSMIAEKPRQTTKSGYGDYVSGASASGLIRRGYAHWKALPSEYGFKDYYVVITDTGRAALKAANGVTPAVLDCAVPLLDVYEVAADALPLELDTAEFLGQGDYVHVQPAYGKRPYFAYVEAVMGDRVIVSHWSYGYVCEHGIEEVTLKLKKAALTAETISAR